MPRPGKDETEEDFVGRCMGVLSRNPADVQRSKEQRLAMCYSTFRKEESARLVGRLRQLAEATRSGKTVQPIIERYHIGALVIKEQFFSLGEMLNAAVRKQFGDKVYVSDFSDIEVVFQRYEDSALGKQGYYKIGYEVASDGAVTLAGSAEAVERKTVYEKSELDAASLLELVSRELRLKVKK